ncbi:MAG TPA: phosphoglycerate kinase [Candidatus Micrarchaeota archaeon]|nr:phosphoglycerate kinase [Candidatus Micrarchaeota archaeon]
MITLDDLDFKGKAVFVRADLNCPVDKTTLKVQDSPRMAGHAKTVRELSGKGAKVVVLAHQGRKGDYDFLPLAQHAVIFQKHVGKPVKFVPDVCGDAAKTAIRNLKPGEIILLDNVRNLDDEKNYKTIAECEHTEIVRELSPLCDIFVLDAFSVSHRPQPSVVGFAAKTIVAGRELQAELEALARVSNPKRPLVFVMGGTKPEDSIGILDDFLKKGKADFALTCGVFGNLMALAKYGKIGEASEKFLVDTKAIGHVEEAKGLLSKYPGKIMVPEDFAYDTNGKRAESTDLPCDGAIMDIGSKTAQKYAQAIAGAGSVVINGPAGVYEKDEFALGTKTILAAIENSHAYSLAGGGHTVSAIGKFVHDRKKIGYISLAGKALIAYLSGEELPGVKIVMEAKLK